MKAKGNGIIMDVRKTDIVNFETEKDGFKYSLQYDEKLNKIMVFSKQLISIKAPQPLTPTRNSNQD